ncbi:hypothetical protein [Nitrosomonas sp. Nm34]|uniref:hypothetical protein n=1 Tax=Nitrosomonas sp. Nm34 TaxID=1881055 RepID=UPI0008EF7E99|nr:hypothetical protein [Nitrosomonas sp. Nm34]SFI31192.1 hypothetical protein SAMN05428978_100555 [Nitrosomonas sp. Nm34]
MKKEEVRRNFSKCCSVAGQFREVFGNEVRLVYANENGQEIGKQSSAGIVVGGVTGDMWVEKKKGVRNGDH